MKAPCCWLCGRDFRSAWFHAQSGGELVQFRDHEPLPDGYAGHSSGLEWLCRGHAPAARELAHLDAAAALVELQRRYGVFPEAEPSPMRDPSLWVTSVGANRARVFALLREATGLPAGEAMALLQSGAFEVARGWPQQLESWEAAFVAAGASVEIRYD